MFLNHRRYHEGLENITPYDVYTGRHAQIIERRKRPRKELHRKEGAIIKSSDNRREIFECPFNGLSGPFSLTTYIGARYLDIPQHLPSGSTYWTMLSHPGVTGDTSPKSGPRPLGSPLSGAGEDTSPAPLNR